MLSFFFGYPPHPQSPRHHIASSHATLCSHTPIRSCSRSPRLTLPPNTTSTKRPRPAYKLVSTEVSTLQAPLPPENLVADLSKLAKSRGALGRGVRATLRAFHRRAAYILCKPQQSDAAYVEIGPAYVLATARLGSLPERPTRYAIEFRAWPALRTLLKWEETTSSVARGRGAVLRKLFNGGRYGRHLFIDYNALSAVVHVAEELIGDTEDIPATSVMELEANVELRRRPLPGVRTVAARCPRRAQHSNGDRKPSLMLWMNPDGVTGGALCPVCLDHSSHGETPPRNMTWRVHYTSDGVAALYTPRKRIRSPVHVQRAMAEYRRQEEMGRDDEDIPVVHGDLALSAGTKGQPSSTEIIKPGQPRGAVGGCVMVSKRQFGQVGEVIGMAYVTASLKMTGDDNTTGAVTVDCKEGTRHRTVGTMARQSCPMQVLLWSDRRSKGPTSAKRIEEVSLFARQSLSWPESDGVEGGAYGDEIVDSDQWLPTPLLSVSAMKPSGWRDVMGQNGRLVSLPASWEASAQAWVLFDIDDVEQLEQEGVVIQAANKVALAVRRDKELSGRCLVMQTGPAGLHVWAELREVRENPRLWFKKQETRAWYSGLGKKLLRATHRGGALRGKIDMSSCSAGRFARRPGWRLLEDGRSFRARVVMYVPSAVRNRQPRLD